jgi:DNA ligase-1
MRSLAGKLRNGLGEQSILACLGQAFATTYIKDDELVVDEFKKLRKNEQIDDIKKALEKPVQAVKQAYYQCPNYALVIDAILKHGLDDLEEHCKLTPGIPLKPMLAYPTKGIHEVLKRFEEAELACEYKYDGERAQIHIMEDGNIKIYSRNSENNTSKYPDVIEFLIQHLHLKKNKTAKKSEEETKTEETEESESKLKVTSAIIDAEVVAYDIEKHIIQPFQKLSTRKRKVRLTFDPYRKRQRRLHLKNLRFEFMNML